jgi:hypothetical protein
MTCHGVTACMCGSILQLASVSSFFRQRLCQLVCKRAKKDRLGSGISPSLSFTPLIWQCQGKREEIESRDAWGVVTLLLSVEGFSQLRRVFLLFGIWLSHRRRQTQR